MAYRTYPMHLDRLSDKSGSVVKVVEKGGDIAKALFVTCPTHSRNSRDEPDSARYRCICFRSLCNEFVPRVFYKVYVNRSAKSRIRRFFSIRVLIRSRAAHPPASHRERCAKSWTSMGIHRVDVQQR